jgi:phage protein D
MSDDREIDERRDDQLHPTPEEIADLRRRVAETYIRGAEVLEQTAALADQLADHEAGEGKAEYAAHERAEAAKARDSAARLLAHAERLRRAPRHGGGGGS